MREQYDKYRGSATPIVQSDLAPRVGVSQGTLSRIQNDRASPEVLKPSQLVALLRGYHFTDKEIRDVARKFSLSLPIDLLEPRIGSRATATGSARYYGAIGAGLVTLREGGEPLRLVSVPQWILDRYDLEDIFVMSVEGCSMACDDVRRSIPEGSEVYFHARLQPEVGEVVACWLPKQEMGILKVYRPEAGYVVLQSYNEKEPPIIIDDDNPGMLQGVMIGDSRPRRR